MPKQLVLADVDFFEFIRTTKLSFAFLFGVTLAQKNSLYRENHVIVSK